MRLDACVNTSCRVDPQLAGLITCGHSQLGPIMSINGWRKHIFRQKLCLYQIYVNIRLLCIRKKLTYTPMRVDWDMAILSFKAILLYIGYLNR